MFCNIFHKYSDWLDTDDNTQIRWCNNCNKRKRRQIKLTRGPSIYMKMLSQNNKERKDAE